MYTIIKEGKRDFVIPNKWITSDNKYYRPPLVVNFEEYVKKSIDPEDSWSKKDITEVLGVAATYADALFALENKNNLSNLNKSEGSIRKMLRKKRCESARKKFDEYIVDVNLANNEKAVKDIKKNKKVEKKKGRKKSKKLEEKPDHELDDTVILSANEDEIEASSTKILEDETVMLELPQYKDVDESSLDSDTFPSVQWKNIASKRSILNSESDVEEPAIKKIRGSPGQEQLDGKKPSPKKNKNTNNSDDLRIDVSSEYEKDLVIGSKDSSGYVTDSAAEITNTPLIESDNYPQTKNIESIKNVEKNIIQSKENVGDNNFELEAYKLTSTECSKISKLISKTIVMQSLNKERCKALEKTIKKLNTKYAEEISRVNTEEIESDINKYWPLKNEKKFKKHFNKLNDLLNDEAYKKHMATMLKRCSDIDEANLIKNVLRKIPDQVLKAYSFGGRFKNSFKDLPFSDCLLRACRFFNEDYTETDYKKKANVHISHAPDRLRSKGHNVPYVNKRANVVELIEEAEE